MSDVVRKLLLLIDATGMKTGAEEAVAATRKVSQGAKEAERALGGKQKATDLAGLALGKLTGVAATAAAALFSVAKFNEALNQADALGKLSQKVGVAVPILSALEYQAGLADVSFGELSISLKEFSENIAAAQRGAKEQSATFALLGVNANAYKGQQDEAARLLAAVSQRFSEMEDGAQKAAVAGELFGRSGLSWVPLLNEGVEGMRRAREELQSLGGIVTEQDAATAEKFNDSFSKLGRTATAFFTQTIPIVPTLTFALDVLNKLGGAINQGTGAVFDILTGVSPGEAAARRNADAGDGAAALRPVAAAPGPTAEERKRAAEDAKKIAEAEEAARERLARQVAEETEARARDTAGVQAFVRAVEIENELLGADELTRRKRLAVVELESLAIDSVTGAYKVSADTLRAARDRLLQLTEENYEAEKATAEHEAAVEQWIRTAADGAATMSEIDAALQAEAAAVGRSAEETADLELHQRALNAALDAGRDDAEAYAAAVVEQARATREAVEADAEWAELRRFFADLDREAADAKREATTATAELAAELRAEIAAVGTGNAARERAAALRQFSAAATGLEAEEVRRLADEYEGLFDELQRAAATDTARRRVDTLREEVALIGATAEEQRRARELADFDRQFEGLEAVVGAERERLIALQAQREELEKLEGLSYDAGAALAAGAKDAVRNWSDLGDVLAGVQSRLTDIALTAFLEKPLADAAGSGLFGLLANAKGNAFGPRGVQAFGSGDVFSSPTLFGFGAGRLGVMGERGPEAVVPLERGPNGKLGVAASGAGASVTIYQTINIGRGGDVAGGVEQSTRQALEGARAAVGSV